MTFTESNTVEQMIIDAACSLHQPSFQLFCQRAKGFKVREESPVDWGRFFGRCFGMAKKS